MTKKDYETIAMAIWRSGYIMDKNIIRQRAKEEIRQLIAYDLAGEFKKDNPHFDKIKFLANCGVRSI